MARRSWVCILMPLLGGCLVQEPPDLEDPEQTRPFVLMNQVDPNPSVVRLIPVALGTPQTEYFTIPIQSEDREPIKGALHFDLHFESQDWLDSDVIEASTFAAGPRDMILEWEVNDDEYFGCHRVTAVFAHVSSFDESEQLVAQNPEAIADSEAISWLVNVYDETDPDVDPAVLTNCPRQETDGSVE